MSNDAMRGDSMQDKRRDSQRSRPPPDSIPAPTHPQCREVPLPWEAPKSAADDPDASFFKNAAEAGIAEVDAGTPVF